MQEVPKNETHVDQCLKVIDRMTAIAAFISPLPELRQGPMLASCLQPFPVDMALPQFLTS